MTDSDAPERTLLDRRHAGTDEAATGTVPPGARPVGTGNGAAGRAPSHHRTGRWIRRAAITPAALLVAIAAVVTIGPRFLPYQVLPVYTGSMRPTFLPGSVIVARPVEASDLRIGDIITFKLPGRASLVTHRIVRRLATPSGPVFLTKGDANGLVDPWQIAATGRGWRYWFDVPRLGFVLGRVQTPAGNLALRAALAALFVIWILAAVWRTPDPARVAAPANASDSTSLGVETP